MMYWVYQVRFGNEDWDLVWKAREAFLPDPQFYQDYRELKFNPSPKSIRKLGDKYQLVASVQANSLDEVFDLGNDVYVPKQIHILPSANFMSSISVGDLIADQNNDLYYVDNIGFKKLSLNMPEALGVYGVADPESIISNIIF